MISLWYLGVKSLPLASRRVECAAVTNPSPADATQRFSDRVADYAAHRPRYPAAAYGFLRERVGLRRGSAVADVGSGTGIFSEPLIDMGCVVYGVEPNEAMRREAERDLAPRHPSFHSVAGTAEATTLPDRSVDLVVAAQAFHWFDPLKAAAECRRILRPGAPAAMVWNKRQTDASPFLRDYEALLNEFGTDYAAVRHDRMEPTRLAQFFSHGYNRVAFANAQHLDRAGLRGRLLSSSYTPAAGDPRRAPMIAATDRLFDRHQRDGTVSIDYETELYLGVP
jgi:SAM-dependent methyltransferase